MPTTIAAMVMVMMSSGIPTRPMTPSTRPAASTLGASAIRDSDRERNRARNISRMATNTAPRVRIWDLNRLCRTLLYNTSMPVNRIRSGAMPSCSVRALRRSFRNRSRRRSSLVSITRTVSRACSRSREK